MRERELQLLDSDNKSFQEDNKRLGDHVQHLERVIAEIEDKNKRMTDLINSQICNNAQMYQDTVMSKLLNTRSPIAKQPFNDTTNETNSGQRLNQILKDERENNDPHYKHFA